MCARGHASDVVGNSNAHCDGCTKGKYADELGMAKCKDCEAGRFQDNRGGWNCTRCFAGWSQPAAGSTGCTRCTAGRYANDRGFAECKLCPWDEYTNDEAAVSCKPCLEFEVYFGFKVFGQCQILWVWGSGFLLVFFVLPCVMWMQKKGCLPCLPNDNQTLVRAMKENTAAHEKTGQALSARHNAGYGNGRKHTKEHTKEVHHHHYHDEGGLEEHGSHEMMVMANGDQLSAARGSCSSQGARQRQSTPPRKRAEEDSAGVDADDWITMNDSKSGRDYFVNKRTRQTTWCAPQYRLVPHGQRFRQGSRISTHPCTLVSHTTAGNDPTLGRDFDVTVELLAKALLNIGACAAGTSRLSPSSKPRGQPPHGSRRCALPGLAC